MHIEIEPAQVSRRVSTHLERTGLLMASNATIHIPGVMDGVWVLGNNALDLLEELANDTKTEVLPEEIPLLVKDPFKIYDRMGVWAVSDSHYDELVFYNPKEAREMLDTLQTQYHADNPKEYLMITLDSVWTQKRCLCMVSRSSFHAFKRYVIKLCATTIDDMSAAAERKEKEKKGSRTRDELVALLRKRTS